MTEPRSVLRTDPRNLPSSLKEAVADALLNIVHARVSGAGEFGRILYGTKPRHALTSAFLLPMRGLEEGDEVTSPIWVSSHGLDFQVVRTVLATIRVKPSFAIYVRLLPNEQDLRRPDCRPTFRLNSETSKKLKVRIRDELNKRWEGLKDNFKNRRQCPRWEEIRNEVRNAVYAAEGVPTNLTNLFEDAEMAGDTAVVDEEAPATQGIEVPPGQAVAIQDRHFEPLRIPQKWLRLDLELPPLEIAPNGSAEERSTAVALHEEVMRNTIAGRLKAWLESDDPDTGGKLWAYPRDQDIHPSQYRDWRRFLEEVRKRNDKPVLPTDLEPRWDIESSLDWRDPSRRNVHIALENRGQDPKQRADQVEHGLFLVSLDVEMPETLHRTLRLERVDPSYRYNRYLGYAAIGFNGGVTARQGVQDVIAFTTTWAPRYTQPRIEPTDFPEIETSFRALTKPESLERLTPLGLCFRAWLAALPSRINTSSGLDPSEVDAIARERHKFAEDLKKWALEADAIDAGLNLLQESRKHWKARGPQADARAIPFEAWLAMNEAMANVMQARVKSDDGRWRLFQLAFILANLPSIATRLECYLDRFRVERDDAVTMLYFATGGGKSEAFFGLLAFALFFDRLRGKALGVSAMIRYPLRLLTIQQAQRTAKVLAQAELVRLRTRYPGMPFSIGFWVGSGGSPNRLNAPGVADVPEIQDRSADKSVEDKLFDDDAKYARARRAWRKLPNCPFCNSETGLRRFPKEGGTLAHVCTNQQCAVNHDGYRALPFFIVDEDIYDFAPSVILGTVDKLALIGHSPRTIRRILGMLGGAIWQHKGNGRLYVPEQRDLEDDDSREKFDKLYPGYPTGKHLFVDPFPALLIQDEAHLLDESLGTFAGLFESTLEGMLAGIAPALGDIIAKTPDGVYRRAKVIAASATVSEPERQLEHLYQRKSPAIQFPYPGPELYRSFYAQPIDPDPLEKDRNALTDPEQRSVQARIYTAFMTNGRPHTATSVSVLSNFHLTITELFRGFVDGGDVGRDKGKTLMQEALSNGPLRDEHTRRIAAASAADIATLLDLHRIALTYVTNKKGGDQIMAAETEETRKKHLAAGIPIGQLQTRLITGSVDQGEIQKVVELVQERVAPGTAFRSLDKEVRSVIATSAVSHGVDVEELNSMFFAGMPSDIAEYIQASSRVGRTHVGFCLLIPTPQRRRDRYIVEVFDIFHRFLERMVQPAAIDRWAEKAVERVIPSLFQSYVCGVLPTSEILTRPPSEKAEVPPMDYAKQIIRRFGRDRQAFVAEIAGFIEGAIGLSTQYRPVAGEYYDNLIRSRLRQKILERLEQQDWETSNLRAFFDNQHDPLMRPMTSLRDVDEAGMIRVAWKEPRGKRLQGSDVVGVMALIRLGVAEAGDDSSSEG